MSDYSYGFLSNHTSWAGVKLTWVMQWSTTTAWCFEPFSKSKSLMFLWFQQYTLQYLKTFWSRILFPVRQIPLKAGKT